MEVPTAVIFPWPSTHTFQQRSAFVSHGLRHQLLFCYQCLPPPIALPLMMIFSPFPQFHLINIEWLVHSHHQVPRPITITPKSTVIATLILRRNTLIHFDPLQMPKTRSKLQTRRHRGWNGIRSDAINIGNNRWNFLLRDTHTTERRTRPAVDQVHQPNNNNSTHRSPKSPKRKLKKN